MWRSHDRGSPLARPRLGGGDGVQRGSCKDTAGDRWLAAWVRSGMGGVGVPGVENTAGLARWIRDNDLPGAAEDLTVELIAGGRSNLTYRLEFRAPGQAAADGPPARRLVLRRPPLGHVLPTAHDMSREYR